MKTLISFFKSIDKSFWQVLAVFAFIILMLLLCQSCATIAHDFKTTDWKEPASFSSFEYPIPDYVWDIEHEEFVPNPMLFDTVIVVEVSNGMAIMEPTDIYDCHYEYAKELLYLHCEWEKWIFNNDICNPFYDDCNFYWWLENVYIKSFENE